MQLTKIGKVYHAKFKDAQGKTKMLTTRQTDKRLAEQTVKEAGIADLEQAAKSGRLTTEAIGKIVTGRKLTVAKCVAPFAEWMKSRAQSARTIDRHVTTIDRWMRDAKVTNLPPSAVTEKQISKWVNRESDAGYATRYCDISSIRAFFSFLCAKGWVAGDPSQAVGVDRESLSHDQKEPTVREPFNDMEVRRLLSYLEKKEETFWYFAVLLSRTSGLRLGDIAQLEWRSFADVPGKLIVHTGKTNRRIEQEMTLELNEALTRIPVESQKYLFPEEREISLDVKRRSRLSVYFSRFCAKAGVQGKSFHALRHSAATAAHSGDKEILIRKLVETLSLKEAQQLLGHASSDTTRKYIH